MSTNRANTNEKIWGVFVGERGDSLELLNSNKGPFPPEKGTTGYVSIGWPAIGDMRIYADDYLGFVEKFRKAYQTEDMSERTLKTIANVVWNFAYTMDIGDFVISPSSSSGYILIGRITSEYIADFHDELKLKKYKNHTYFVHFREVEWLAVIPEGSNKYSELNRIGQLTVTQPDISISTIKELIKTGP